MLFAVIAPLVLVTWTGDNGCCAGPGTAGLYQGTLLSATEKNALDIWYIGNASVGFDLRIIGMVARLGKSDWRGEDALVQGEWGSNHPTARRESRVSLVGAGL
jgi:hypothetical protein